jgi:hypothetical protein
MATFTPDYNAGQTVAVITTGTTSCPSAVREGVVIQATAIQLTSGTTYTYDVRLDGDNGTTRVAAANIFATIREAIAEYNTRLGGAGSPPIV